ncbi:MAG: elongation factor 1-beta [Candidatus Aenigmatarchaeota archaeon]
MGNVALTMTINPESPETDLGKIKSELEKLDGFKSVQERPIAFGMKQLIVMFVFNDRAGADTDKIENVIAKINGVASVETGDITLI